MKPKPKFLFSTLMVMALTLCLNMTGDRAFAEELDIINRPVNMSGLTGLLFTSSPYVLQKGVVEFGLGIMNESSETPNFTINEFPISVTVGLPDSELALRTSYINVKTSSPDPGGTTLYERKTGNVELSYKWNFRKQPEESIRPAFGFILSGIVPTDSYRNMIISGVRDWGMRLGITTGTEITWKDYMLAVYADAQMQAQDLNREKNIRDLYGIFNVGLLFPISKYRNLQMFVEYNQVVGRDRITLEGSDYYGVSYGIRLVSERFNLTLGSQFIDRRAEGYTKSNRLVGIISSKF